jgi:energy-coupling factor transport system ATP-binding protein
MGLADELHRRGRTIVMVTHDMALVAEYASRVVVMQAGQVMLDAPPQTVFQRPEVLAATGLQLPPVLELANALRAGGWAVNGLTLDELAQAMAEAVSQRAYSQASGD